MIIFIGYDSNNFFRLGAASPQAVKKLLALSEQSKPRHKSQPGHDRELQPSPATIKPDRAEQPTPVNLTSESSSVSGRPKDGIRARDGMSLQKMQSLAYSHRFALPLRYTTRMPE